MNLKSDIPIEFLQPNKDWKYPDICITTKERIIRSASINPFSVNDNFFAQIIAIVMVIASIKYGNYLSTLIFSAGTMTLIFYHAKKNIFYLPRYFLAQYIRTLPRYSSSRNGLSARYYSEFNHNGKIETFYYAEFVSANENDEFILEIDANNMIRGCRKITTTKKPNLEFENPQK